MVIPAVFLMWDTEDDKCVLYSISRSQHQRVLA